jgi:hypothetical protein
LQNFEPLDKGKVGQGNGVTAEFIEWNEDKFELGFIVQIAEFFGLYSSSED